MIFRPLFLMSAFALLAPALSAQAERAPTPDETARFLAGLPVRGTPLEAQSREPGWAEHATEFDTAWRKLEERQLAKIRAWGAEFLAGEYHAPGPVFYMFSGPDALYAQAFFPKASTYVLAGLEPTGPIPEVLPLSPEALAAGLANLRKSLNSVLSWSFFITKDMKVDLRQNQLGGTLPVLYVFLARAGCRLESVDSVALDKGGAFARKGTAGVRLVFSRPGGERQMLYYFTSDLSNGGIRSQPGLLKYCEQLGAGRSLLKAGSYLLHLGSFSTMRDFLLTHSAVIVQDDSGIPVRYFDPRRWAVRYFGSYPGPIDLFKQHLQPDLGAIYAKSNPPPLPFGFGYRWQPSQSSLLLATPRAMPRAAIPPSFLPPAE